MARDITIQDIVKKFLEDNGYDGLCSMDPGHCACSLDDNFMSCSFANVDDCVAARKVHDENSAELRPV